ncbi:hypothetical protein E9840_08330 [Tissierella creatinini]|nr:hypothetical protein E9840_08330 [Tissierella creatinini]TJX61492.1 hypothetical protein E8P77_18470 [Soehngenia saccharolytica]
METLLEEKVIKSHEPVKLLRKKSYPTYQLYATINSSKVGIDNALKISILETMSWLRKRFRDMEIPEEIKFPESQDYESVSEEDFKSFRLDEGYIVDVVFLKEKGIWAFHLSEPDLGPEPDDYSLGRKPVPGRIFETNIGFTINKDSELECGFKTICSEPVNSTATCEVFRPAVIKSLVRNPLLGLRQIHPIIENAHVMDSINKIKRLKDFINDNKRQLPLVLISEYSKQADISIPKFEDIGLDKVNFRSSPLKDFYPEFPTPSEKCELPIALDDLIKYKMSFAQFVVIPFNYIDDYNKVMDKGYSLHPGEIRIINPELHLESGRYFSNLEINKDKDFKLKFEKYLEEYPKGKNINFGSVKFLNEARIELQQQIINISNSKEELANILEEKHKASIQKYIDRINRLEKVVDEKDQKIDRLKEEINYYKDKAKDREEEFENYRNEFIEENAKLNKEIKRKNQLLDRPKKVEAIPEWVNKYYEGRILLHNRALGLISKIKPDIDINLLCDSLEYLSSEYYDWTFGMISEEELNELCSLKYNRRFEVTPNNETSIKAYPMDYKIKYGHGPTGKLREVVLNTHLKVGKGNENVIRIYFHIDRENKVLVIGSLPEHLKLASDKK